MTEDDLNDLDSLLTLLAGAPPRRLEVLAAAVQAYEREAKSDEGFASRAITYSRSGIDERARELRALGRLEEAVAMFSTNLHSVEGVRKALTLDVGVHRENDLVVLLAALVRDQHEQAAAALEELNANLKKNLEASP